MSLGKSYIQKRSIMRATFEMIKTAIIFLTVFFFACGECNNLLAGEKREIKSNDLAGKSIFLVRNEVNGFTFMATITKLDLPISTIEVDQIVANKNFQESKKHALDIHYFLNIYAICDSGSQSITAKSSLLKLTVGDTMYRREIVPLKACNLLTVTERTLLYSIPLNKEEAVGIQSFIFRVSFLHEHDDKLISFDFSGLEVGKSNIELDLQTNATQRDLDLPEKTTQPQSGSACADFENSSSPDAGVAPEEVAAEAAEAKDQPQSDE